MTYAVKYGTPMATLIVDIKKIELKMRFSEIEFEFLEIDFWKLIWKKRFLEIDLEKKDLN